jgi:DNA-binding NarL/FixJ family response regulator
MIIDLDLPSGGGLELVEALAQSAVPARPMLLASRISNEDFLRSRRLDVRGLFLKSMPTHLLLQAIRTVHAGGEFLEKNVLLEAFSTLLQNAPLAKGRGDGLTQRERAIMDLVVTGMSNSVIAGKLRIKEGTVKTHVHRIYEKLGLHSRFQLMAFARDKGSS